MICSFSEFEDDKQKELNNIFKNIIESLDSSVPIKWNESDDKMIGSFMYNDKIYEIHIIILNDVYFYKFYLYDEDLDILSTELVNSKERINRVLGTVKSGIKYLIETRNPRNIVYMITDYSDFRFKLYHSFAIELNKKYEYKYQLMKYENNKLFILYKDDIEKIYETIKQYMQ